MYHNRTRHWKHLHTFSTALGSHVFHVLDRRYSEYIIYLIVIGQSIIRKISVISTFKF